MKVCFCLPGLSIGPVGGYKIVFEYANRLITNGHDVTVAFNCNKTFIKYNLPELLRQKVCYYFVKKSPKWFSLNKNIRKICVNGINDNTIPCGDLVIATAVDTSQEVFDLSPNKGEKVYFIQDFENWNFTDEEVFKTYEFNMKNIVISKWLKLIVDSRSQFPSTYIANGIDLNVFGVDLPINERNPHSIAMLYHKSEHKGSKYGLEAIYRIKELYPDLEVRLFGTPKRPNDLPNWIEYSRSISQEKLRSLYNKSAVFLCSSVEEGFGLTGAESMACGCALVSTSYEGVFEYAENNKNAMVSPIKDVESLVNNIDKLFSNIDMRTKLATEGQRNIQKLSWEKSVFLFEDTLKDLIHTTSQRSVKC